jgi:hypothetical protein
MFFFCKMRVRYDAHVMPKHAVQSILNNFVNVELRLTVSFLLIYVLYHMEWLDRSSCLVER